MQKIKKFSTIFSLAFILEFSLVANAQHTKENMNGDSTSNTPSNTDEIGAKTIIKGNIATTYLYRTTSNIKHAIFLEFVSRKIELIGTCNFPTKNRKKLYGDLILSIPIFEDGSIYKKAGGIKIEKSSGDDFLDKSSINIVKKAAPFDPIPEALRIQGKENVFILFSRFKYTKETLEISDKAHDFDCKNMTR